jgi:rare lipoprotein A
VIGFLAGALSVVAMPRGSHADPLSPPRAKVGQASWYGHEFAKRRTASGERFDPTKMTGAHRTLPLGTVVRVTNLRNGRSVLVKITDRGPYRRRREIDLSYGAARELGMLQRGVTPVRIERLDS